MKQSQRDWMKTADEANLFFQIQGVGGQLFKLQSKYAVAKMTGDEDYLSMFHELEKVMAILRAELEKRFSIGFADFDLWMVYWQRYTQTLGVDKMREFIKRILNGEQLSELAPEQTYREWFNAQLKEPNLIPK